MVPSPMIAMAARYLTKVAFGAIAGYLALGLAIALFRPAEVAAKAPAPTNTVPHPHTHEQAPLNSFSTIIVPTTSTATPANTAAPATVIEYVTVRAPYPTSISDAYATYPYTTCAALWGAFCFVALVLCAMFTFSLWCQQMLAKRREKKRVRIAKQKLEDFEKAPCKMTWLAEEAAKQEEAKYRTGARSEADYWDEFQ